MSVVTFERKQGTGAWSETELNIILAALNVAIVSGDGRGWETGTTEKDDAQFYLLGPLPDQACELCVSRIGGRYMGAHRAEEIGRRNAVPGELVVRVRPTKVVSAFNVAV